MRLFSAISMMTWCWFAITDRSSIDTTAEKQYASASWFVYVFLLLYIAAKLAK